MENYVEVNEEKCSEVHNCMCTREKDGKIYCRGCGNVQPGKDEENMKKLFISQQMRGKSDDEILLEREKAIKAAEKLVGEPVEVIDSFFQSAPVDAKPLWFLGKSLELLADADVAYFAEGWEEARGYQNFCEMYEAYHELGGNGMITKMMHEIEELHLKKKEKERER